LEIAQQRASAVEQQNIYLVMLLQHQQAIAEAVAAWWTEIWKAFDEANIKCKTG
jgi:hypothetical protein